MSVNRDRPHVLVLPEDDANRQVANGFHLQVDPTRQRQMHVLTEAGGWIKVLDQFNSDQVAGMEGCTHRFLILLIDFDDNPDRLRVAKARIPGHLTDRVFILGALGKPEDLKAARLGSYEVIGGAMAQDCRQDTDTIWNHDLLRHNSSELVRLRQNVRQILF